MAAGVLVFGISVAAQAPDAESHDWYPSTCCSGNDCAPVTKTETVENSKLANMFGVPRAYATPGIMVVTTIHGTVPVPPDFPRRESPDGQMHACIHVSDGTTRYGDETSAPPAGIKRLICLFMPPSN
jgi:hypothetical protein